MESMPVDDLLNSWAYYRDECPGMDLKAWYGLLMPNPANEVLETLRMEFRRILHLIVLLPVKIMHSGRRIIYRIIGYNNWLKDFCYLGVSSPDRARLKSFHNLHCTVGTIGCFQAQHSALARNKSATYVNNIS
jgi:hypothetical protein